MKGATIRITDKAGRSITGTVADVDDASDDAISGHYNLVAKATFKHRPQWPSMAAERTIYLDDENHWIDSLGQPITVETLKPGPPQGPQLVRQQQ